MQRCTSQAWAANSARLSLSRLHTDTLQAYFGLRGPALINRASAMHRPRRDKIEKLRVVSPACHVQ